MQLDGRPNIIVVGVGHSGTTIVTKLLQTLGWNAPKADARYAEHVGIRQANTVALSKGKLPKSANGLVTDLAAHVPWTVKDPRFTVTLPLWQPLFTQLCDTVPTLLWIQKDLARVKRSYNKRGEKVGRIAGNRWKGAQRGYTVDQQFEMVTNQCDRWPGPVIEVNYDQLSEAAAMFKPR